MEISEIKATVPRKPLLIRSVLLLNCCRKRVEICKSQKSGEIYQGARELVPRGGLPAWRVGARAG